jgi:ABC-type Fe3+/spermidine/putrescine transport system ATPase subunit
VDGDKEAIRMTAQGITFRSVSKSYGDHCALSQISVTLTPGEHTAILGPSACGKTTFLRLLAGLEAPSSGEIVSDSTVLASTFRILVPPHERKLAMVFQDLALWPNLTVLGNAMLGLSGRNGARNSANEALTLCGIASLADRKPGTLSGGQQQRVALARALAAEPSFLLLDEPFSGLDLVTKSQLLQDINSLAAKRGFTIVLVCHDPFEATTICQRALVLDQGRVVEQGSLSELLLAPQSEILKVFREHLRGLSAKP